MRVDLTGASSTARASPPAAGVSAIAVDTLRAPRALGKPPAERRQDDAEEDRQRVVEHDGELAEDLAHHPVLEDQLAGVVPENAAAEPDDPREAAHQPGQERAAEHHDRDGEPDAEDHQAEVLAADGGDGEHVVEAHHHVGHDDDPDRLQERRPLTDLMALGAGLTRSLPDELDGDPDEQHPADELQERNAQQEGQERDDQQAKGHRADRAPHASPPLLAGGQRAHGQGDDERVVTGEQQVADDDAQELGPERRIGDAHAWTPKTPTTLTAGAPPPAPTLGERAATTA